MHIPGTTRARKAFATVAGAIRRRSRRGVILLYHRVAGPRFDPLLLDVSPANFDAQMAVLRREANVLSLSEFETRRRANTLPERAAAVTFDDGFADNLHVAVPILVRHGVPATVFVVSGMVGAPGEFWWDDIERIAFTTRPLGANAPAVVPTRWPGDAGSPPPDPGWNALSSADPTPRYTLYRALHEAILPLPPVRQAAAMADLRVWAGVEHSARPSHRTLTSDELRSLASSPGISIGAHANAHSVLALMSAAEQRHELIESRAALQLALGKLVGKVAYPYGTGTDVSRKTTRAAREAGFDTGYSNRKMTAWRWSNRWRVPRILVRDWDAAGFSRQLEGWWAL